ncbi:MAG: hypothetical protein K2J12_06360 [Muribaculaceae bacterium]|nr:hypothetical protein [Muribaculaceae bacterium]
MKGYKISMLLFPAVLAGICGCSQSGTSDVAVDYADFARYAAELVLNRDVASEEAFYNEVESHKDAFRAMAEVLDIDSNTPRDWTQLLAVRGFAKDIDSISPTSQRVEDMLAYLIQKSENEGVKLPVKRFASVIWGKPQSIIFNDSCMLIAFNHYLGSEHPAYASLDNYKRQSKTENAMTYDIAEALMATQYPYVKSESSSVINRLIYEGALIEAKMRLVRNSSQAEALGYSDEQLKWLKDNEKEIWNKMVSSKMLFDNSATLAERLVSPAPFTAPLSTDTPGRAGRFIGHNIVKKYIETNPNIKVSDLLKPEFYNKSNPLADIPYTGN